MSKHNPIVRKARRDEAIALGFSPAEADRMRDWGSTRRTDAQESRLIELEIKAPDERNDKEQDQLDALRNRERLPNGLPGGAESSRAATFNRWSSRRGGGFPSNVLAYIATINRKADKNIYDHYGYRVFYWEYVREYAPADARAATESHDS